MVKSQDMLRDSLYKKGLIRWYEN